MPAPRLALRDPFALRALVLVLVVATFVAAGGERTKRIAAAFDWQGVMLPANFRIDAWVTPPTYTGKPPMILQGLRPGEPVQTAAELVCAGRQHPGHPRHRQVHLDVVASGGVSDPKPAAQAAHAPSGTEERQFVINDAGAVTVRGAASRDVTWQFTAIPDKPPTIALAKDPEGQARGAMLLSYKLEDDYGVVGAQATFTLQEREGTNGQPPRVALRARPISRWCCRRRAPRAASAQTTKDLTEHPWAGADVAMTLIGPRRRRQRGQERAVRAAAARAAVHQADGARAGRAAARSCARRRRAGARCSPRSTR